MKKVNTASGTSLFTILLVVFVVLKILGVIDWSWWVVLLLPFGIEFALALAVLMLVMILCMKKEH